MQCLFVCTCNADYSFDNVSLISTCLVILSLSPQVFEAKDDLELSPRTGATTKASGSGGEAVGAPEEEELGDLDQALELFDSVDGDGPLLPGPWTKDSSLVTSQSSSTHVSLFVGWSLTVNVFVGFSSNSSSHVL